MANNVSLVILAIVALSVNKITPWKSLLPVYEPNVPAPNAKASTPTVILLYK